MRTTTCRIRPHGISVRDNKLYYEEGHVQIWKELSDAEFIQHFMPSLNAMNPIDRRDSLLNSPMPMLQAATSHSTGSSSSGSSTHNAPSTQIPSKRPKYRLVLLLPGPPPRYLTINLTSGLNDLQWGRDANKLSPRHLTIRSIHRGRFLMGNFSTDNDYPGVPLEPRVFEQVENFEANWVEIKFQTSKGLRDCYDLCAQVLKKVNS